MICCFKKSRDSTVRAALPNSRYVSRWRYDCDFKNCLFIFYKMKSRSFTKKFMLKNWTKFLEAIFLICLFPSLREMKSCLTYCSLTYFISNKVRILVKNHQKQHNYKNEPVHIFQKVILNSPPVVITDPLSQLHDQC